MHIKCLGQGNQLNLVFLHGWGVDHRIWKSVASRLDAEFQLFLVDIPSVHEESKTWSIFKTNLLSSLPDKFALIGWSMGGLFATRLAIEHPERVSHLINVASSPCFVKKEQWLGIETQVLNDFLTAFDEHPAKTREQFLAMQLGSASSSYSRGDGVVWDALRSGLLCLAEWDLRSKLESLICKTCFMFGRKDRIVPFRLKKNMEKTYPLFRYISFDDAGHSLFLSDEDAFIQALLECL